MESIGTGIVVLVIIVAVFFALKASTRHFKGQGGCCGGGPDIKLPKKKLEGKKLGEFTLHVEGMTCKHCRTKVEEAVNGIDGAVCRVSLPKKTAVVSYDRQIDRADVIAKIREAGYEAVEKL